MIRMTFDRDRGGCADRSTGAAATADERRRNARREIVVTSPSEAVPQRELNRALIDLSRDLAERPAVRVAVRDVPVWMVQHVERLDADLDLLAAGHRDALANAQIEIPRRRVGQHVPRLDAERARRRPDERRRVEPLGG